MRFRSLSCEDCSYCILKLASIPCWNRNLSQTALDIENKALDRNFVPRFLGSSLLVLSLLVYSRSRGRARRKHFAQKGTQMRTMAVFLLVQREHKGREELRRPTVPEPWIKRTSLSLARFGTHPNSRYRARRVIYNCSSRRAGRREKKWRKGERRAAKRRQPRARDGTGREVLGRVTFVIQGSGAVRGGRDGDGRGQSDFCCAQAAAAARRDAFDGVCAATSPFSQA